MNPLGAKTEAVPFNKEEILELFGMAIMIYLKIEMEKGKSADDIVKKYLKVNKWDTQRH